MSEKMSRRNFLKAAATAAGATALVGAAGCQGQQAKAPAAPSGATSSGNPMCQDFSSQEIVWCNNMKNLGMFLETDKVGFDYIAKELGIKTAYVGPDKNDIPAFVAAIEQAVSRKPAGMMVVGWDASALIQPINTAIDAGIPTVAIDADVPDSKRLSFVGTEWTDIGVNQAKAMLQKLNGKTGKIGVLMLVAGENMQRAYAGFQKVMKDSGNEIIGPFEDKGEMTQSAQIATDLIRGNPDLVGLAGFDEGSVGIGLAIKEEGKKDQIIATQVNPSPQQLQLLQEGYLYALTGQKRELFTYYGVKSILEYLYNTVQATKDDKAAGLLPIPYHYNTGTYVVTQDNMEYWLE
jgi:ABC-type sugar transport system substrate-binding protein